MGQAESLAVYDQPIVIEGADVQKLELISADCNQPFFLLYLCGFYIVNSMILLLHRFFYGNRYWLSVGQLLHHFWATSCRKETPQ